MSGNTIQGTYEIDTLIGTDENDLLIGLEGNDALNGGAGNDVYVYNKGDGNDTITDTGGALDVLELGNGITTAWLSRDTHNLYVMASAPNGQGGYTSGTITLANWFDSVDNRIEKIKLADGRVIEVSEMLATPLNGSGLIVGNVGDDIIYGSPDNDILQGMAGNDTLVGNTGNDTYRLGRGDGSDIILDDDTADGNKDVAEFGANIATDELWFRHVDNDLEISVIGTSDKFTVQNWYHQNQINNQYQIEEFHTADGKVLLNSQVEALVSAMASFAPPPAGQTTLTPEQQAALHPVLAANWH